MKKGSKAKRGKERRFLRPAREFRGSFDPQEIKRLVQKMGRLIFGERCVLAAEQVAGKI